VAISVPSPRTATRRAAPLRLAALAPLGESGRPLSALHHPLARDLGAVLPGHTWGRCGSFVAESVKASGSFPRSGAFLSRRTGLSLSHSPVSPFLSR
jgi:hypothetical protein